MSEIKKLLRSLGVTRVSELNGIVEYRLDGNGLKVLLVENHAAPVVATMVVYRVGSRNEGVGYTGSTHFLEHMMFKGTHAHNPADGTGVMETFAPVGALLNATTSLDRTNYFECVPSQYLGLTLEVEADRMRNLVLRREDRDSEMTVVRNEFERGENSPGSIMYQRLFANAYREHPYHHPTIGWLSDVEGVPMARMKAFYDTYYWPNNATVMIVGDFDPAAAITMVVEHFGKIPASKDPIPDVYTTEPPQEGEVRFEINRPSKQTPEVWIGFRVPEAEHEDTYALDALAQILGGSEPSTRLYKALVDTGKAVSASAFAQSNRDPSLFIVSATCAPGVDPAEVEKIILDEVEKAGKAGSVSDKELAIVKSANRKGTTLQRDDAMKFASLLCQGEAVADWRWIATYDDRFDEVTTTAIEAVAARYMTRRSRTVGHFIPESVEETAVAAPAPTTSVAETKTFDARVRRFTLDNGLTVLALATPGTGTVSVTGSINAGECFRSFDKTLVPELTAVLLTDGSRDLSKQSLAEGLNTMGTSLHFNTGDFYVNFGSTLVVPDLPAYLELLARVVTSPLYDAAEVDRTKARFAAFIRRNSSDTSRVASSTLSRALYGTDSVFHNKPYDELGAELANISRDDLVGFHKAQYSPANTLITIVGDIDADNVLDVLPEGLKSWTGSEATSIIKPAFVMPTAASRHNVSIPGKANVDIAVGLPAPVDRMSPDFYAYKLANAALGHDTIGSRLGKVVRVREGLTYGIYSSLGDVTVTGAPWKITVSTNPANIERVLALVSEVVEKYRSEGISDRELADESSRVYGEFVVGMRNSLGLARAIHQYELIGVGIGVMDTLESAYKAVTKDQVNEAIRKYLRLDTAVTVVAGSI
mgnify:CR=1 FL=1